MTGIVLDSINKPEKNFYKVMIMAGANVIGDLIAVYVFKSLKAVAVVSIAFTILGILFGGYYLKKYADINMIKALPAGVRFYKEQYTKFRNRGKQVHQSKAESDESKKLQMKDE